MRKKSIPPLKKIKFVPACSNKDYVGSRTAATVLHKRGSTANGG